MSTTPSLKIINNVVLTAQGTGFTGKQGNDSDAITDEYDLANVVTIGGQCHSMVGLILTATAVTVYDDDDDKPVDFDYLYYWCDVDTYIQIIGSATCATFKVLARAGFTLTYNKVLAAANTTPITGGSEPAVTDIDSIVIGNYSGGSGNYVFAVFD